jgi:ferredoxin-NADP reductase
MATARTFLLPVHRWIGLCAAIPFLLVALTGASMAFRPQLDPLLNPQLLTVPQCAAPLALDALTAAAQAANPSAGPLRAIRIYGGSGVPVRVRFDDGRWVYLDPCSGSVTGIEALYGGLFGTAAWLHIYGFMGNHEAVAGGMALLFALGTLTCGLVLWWPATRQALRSALRLRGGLSGRAYSINLHKVLALYAAPVLLVSAVTGIPQAFEWGQHPGTAPRATIVANPAHAHGAPGPATLESMWQQAQALVPQTQRTQIRFAKDPGGLVTFEMVARDAPHANALSYVYFSGLTGEQLKVVPHASNSAGHKAYLFAAALHYGWVGGVLGQLLLMLGALAVPVLAWTGTASYLRRRRPPAAPALRDVVIARKTIEATDITSFHLAAMDGRPLPPCGAGAHIDVHLPGGLSRQYSLCNDPANSQHYQIGVLRVPASRGGSHAMHRLNEGAIIRISDPKNHFPLVEGASYSLLLAGGIGITPILSMAERLYRLDANFELHYCARSPERAAFRQRILDSPFAARSAFYFSEGPAHQQVDLPELLAQVDPGRHLYVCGPKGFMDTVITTALQLGWDEQQVHREYFAGSATASKDDSAFDIKLASSGAVVRVAPGQSAVAALAKAGINIPVSCEQGVCGTCVTRVLDGVPDHRDLFLNTAEKARNDCFTPCCSRSLSPSLTLDL